jgi:sugar lactone lactonase YvrE
MNRLTMICTLSFAGLTLLSPVAHADVAPELEWQQKLSSCLPADVVLDDEGRSYVACQDTSTRAVQVFAYGQDGTPLAQIALPIPDKLVPRPVDLAWAEGTLYLAVSALRTTSTDALLVALGTPELDERWRTTRANAAAMSIATAPDGGPWLALTETSANSDIVLLGFDPAGALRAQTRYDSGQDDLLGAQRRSLAVDRTGHVYVAAHRELLRVSPRGQLLWRAEHPAYAVAVDESDYALVTSPRAPEGQTARFAPDGTRVMHVDHGGFAVAAGASDQIWLSGTRVTSDAREWDLLTTLLDDRGQVTFTDRYDGGDQDRFVDLGVDASGAAYVLSSSYVRSGLFGTADRYLILKYTATAGRVWTESYGWTGLPKALAVTAEGRIVATGADGTASWTEQHDAAACLWWWPGCWFPG